MTVSIQNPRWEQTPQETANGIVPSVEQFPPGDVLRYGALIDGVKDDTAAFQSAIDSGHSAFCQVEGTTNIEGTVVMNGDKSLTLNAGLNFERQSGGSTAPMLHMYGDKNVFNPNGATIRHNLYSHSDGIIRIGSAAGEVEGGTSDVTCYGNQISSHFKLVGAWGVTAQDGSIGLYIESIRRKKFAVSNPTYDTHIEAGEILNCDIGLVTSSDVNRSDLKLVIRQFGTAAVVANGSYGNKFNFRIETPQAIQPEVWREAIHLGTLNYLGTESGTDPTYRLSACYNNRFDVYVELEGSGDRKARVINWNEPGLSASEGNNDFFIVGQFGGGIGVDGTTDRSGIGSNVIYSSATIASYNRPCKFHELNLRRLDDDSGSYERKDSWGMLTGRVTNVAEGETVGLFAIDYIGTTRASLLVKLMINARSAQRNVATVGEQIWAFELQSDNSYNVSQPADFTTSFGGAVPAVTVSATAEAGTVANTMKVTISITGGDASGSNRYICAWKAEYLHSNLVGTNFDPDNDITLYP